jgi:RNA polymerase sigma-70 factor (ECF subfamily)
LNHGVRTLKANTMTDNSHQEPLIKLAADGDSAALNELFEQHRERLKKMIRMRLNRRLQGRVDDSDVLQDAYLEAYRRLPEYLADPQAPFFLWLRKITGQKLIDVHRRHLGARARDARLEVCLQRGRLPMASSVSIAGQLLGRLTSPTEAAVRAEKRLLLQEALGRMEEIDREILSLRHHEDLSNQEAAEELGIDTSAASKRFIRALQRLQKMLGEMGLVE